MRIHHAFILKVSQVFLLFVPVSKQTGSVSSCDSTLPYGLSTLQRTQPKNGNWLHRNQVSVTIDESCHNNLCWCLQHKSPPTAKPPNHNHSDNDDDFFDGDDGNDDDTNGDVRGINMAAFEGAWCPRRIWSQTVKPAAENSRDVSPTR